MENETECCQKSNCKKQNLDSMSNWIFNDKEIFRKNIKDFLKKRQKIDDMITHLDEKFGIDLSVLTYESMLPTFDDMISQMFPCKETFDFLLTYFYETYRNYQENDKDNDMIILEVRHKENENSKVIKEKYSFKNEDEFLDFLFDLNNSKINELKYSQKSYGNCKNHHNDENKQNNKNCDCKRDDFERNQKNCNQATEQKNIGENKERQQKIISDMVLELEKFFQAFS